MPQMEYLNDAAARKCDEKNAPPAAPFSTTPAKLTGSLPRERRARKFKAHPEFVEGESRNFSLSE